MNKIRWRKKKSFHELDMGDFKITVLDTHVNYPGQWIMHCQPFYYNRKLNVLTEDGAKELAVNLVANKLRELLSGLHEIFPGVYLG